MPDNKDGPMPDWARSTIKWGAALLAMLLVVLFTVPRVIDELSGAIELEQTDSGDELDVEDVEEAEPEAIDEGVEIALLDLSERNGTVEQVTTEQIELGAAGGQQMLLGFDHIPADTACLIEVVLEVLVVEAVAGELYVRPAQLLEPDTLTAGAPLPADTIIEGTEPAAAVTDGSPGRLMWEIRDIYTLASREAPADVVVLSVYPQVEEEDTEFRMVLGAIEGGQDVAATLRWRAVQGCEMELEGEPPGAAEEGVEEAEDQVEA